MSETKADTTPRFTFSATQLEMFEGSPESCQRKWYLSYVLRLPSQTTKSQAFGTTLHEVLERHFEADDQGRGPDGAPVVVFPPGWDKALTPAESDLAKRLYDMGLGAGLLDRPYGRKIEREFRVPLLEDVQLLGYIDLHNENTVIDHKTTSAMRWAKSAEALKTNTQMLVYAGVLTLDAIRRTGKPLPTVTIRHNVFCTGASREETGPRVRRTEAVVTAEEVDHAWSQFQARARAMTEVAKIKDWVDVPYGREVACNAFGGCQYRRICGGMESPQEYADRVKRGPAVLVPSESPGGGVSMSMLNLLKKAAGGAPPAAPNPPAPVAPAPTPPPVAQAPVLPVLPPAINSPAPTPAPAAPANPAAPNPNQPGQAPTPWASAGCKACSGTGVSSKGNPCLVCDALAKVENRPTSDDFLWAFEGGILRWTAKGGTLPPPAPTAPPPAEKPSDQAAGPAPTAPPPETPAAEPPKRTRKKAEAAPGPATTAVVGAGVATGPAAAEALVGPLPAFTLCIGCRPVAKQATMLETIHLAAATAFAKTKGTPFYAIQAFERRDALSHSMPDIVREFVHQGATVVAPANPAPDLASFLAALKPLAAEVYEA